MSFVARNHPQQTATRGPLDDVDDRRTPPELLNECAQLAGVKRFTLDVAASSINAVADNYYTRELNGLTEPWGPGWNVWCNPPYSDIRPWVSKAHHEAHRCDRIAMLLPANRTEQAWWQDLVEPTRDYHGTVDRFNLDVHFLAGRRRFDRPGWTKPAKGDRPPFGLCLLVWS